ncbi:DHA1 family multidrug resistance protein-like MFS transporter [Melghirimyces profundicolus]|uniref:DHA1 family multidrug resistance protein-like MFS transporter n=1 Tax=Melghirimyces profundicolus TaxID=1242148 RepID=A0A2T6BQB5_9BACL|nr:MFS transporter [Melghirimyces profundicolus]PTX58293.1 DHA1 family multidrug resistance protein-like MFS transporter [Melghirimyces profundicolus]
MEIWRRNLYILMASQFLVMGAMSMIIPFLPLYLKDEMGVTDPEKTQLWAGLIFGINFLSAFVMAPIWGSLADKVGRKIMVLRSGFGMTIVIFLMGLATSPLQLLILRLLNGTVSGFIPASISLVATNTPKERTGYALGMLQSGAVSGSIMGPFIGGIMAEVVDYRTIFSLTALMIGLATLVVTFAVKEVSKPEPAQERAGFLAEGSHIFHRKPLPILFSVGFMLQFAMLAPMPQMSLFVDQLGAPGGYLAFFAGLVTAVTGSANMLASPRLGRLGDQFGSDRVLFFAMLGAAVSFVPHAMVTSVWQLLVLRFLLGLCMGGLLPSLHSLIRKNAPRGKESTAYGYSTSAVFLGHMLGPITGGFLAGWIGIRGLFLLTAGLLVAGAFWLRSGLRRSAASESRRASSGSRHVSRRVVNSS